MEEFSAGETLGGQVQAAKIAAVKLVKIALIASRRPIDLETRA